MAKPTVFVSRMIPQEGIDLLKKECDVTVSPHDRVLSKQELIEGIKGKDALLCLLTDKIDSEVLDSNPKQKGGGRFDHRHGCHHHKWWGWGFY